jgi:serine/threonine protein kinase
MPSFWKSSRFTKPATGSRSRCPDILGFIGIAFDEQNPPQKGLHPLTTDTSPKFADVSMNGASFDVRKVAVNTLPTGLADDLLKSRDFVIVKQPRLESFETENRDALDEIATELEVLRHQPLRNHENIIDLIGIAYHNAGDAEEPNIIPALVIEYAEFGNLAAYQADGNGRDINDKIDICSDAAQGLKVLHDSGVIHGDFKASNLLVCRHESRKFIVKVSDFGFCLSTHDHNIHLIGFTRYLDAPEAEDAEPVDPRFLVQLDIYSYGLFLYSVFKNGTDYFEAISEAERDEYAKKVKKTPLLARLLQLNLLHTMANERCMLFIPCKILEYSLKPSPRRRFHNMGNIVQLIRAAKPSDSNSEGHEHEPIYQPRRFTIEGFHKTRNHLSRLYRKLISDYVVSLGDDEALLSLLKDEFLKRAELEIDLFHGRLEPNADHFMFVPVHHLCVVDDTLGLLPQQPHAGTDEPSSKKRERGNTTLSYYRSLISTMPDQREVREEKEESWEWRPSTTNMPDVSTDSSRQYFLPRDSDTLVVSPNS